MKNNPIAAMLALTAISLGSLSANTVAFDGPLQVSDAKVRTDYLSVTPGVPMEQGVWYIDRVKPNAFGVVNFQGADRLHIRIDAADQSGSAYNNIQGRVALVAPNTTTVSASIYLNPEWNDLENGFRAGIGTNAITLSDEFRWGMYSISNQKSGNDDVGSVAFRILSSSGWQVIELEEADAELGDWVTLEIISAGEQTKYYANNTLIYTDNHEYTVGSFQNITLNSFNGGESYNVYWDNISAVPEPATYAMLFGAAVAGYAILRRRKSIKA